VSTDAWQTDRALLRGHFDDILPEGQTEAEYWQAQGPASAAAEAEEERLFERCFQTKRGGAFLEIGIGYNPRPARITHMVACGVSYCGLDLEVICARHRGVLEAAAGMGLSFRLIGNRAGSYLYNLVDLARAGETFDVIYFDGNHTMYIDAGPLVIAATLLAPDGILVVDDIAWSLSRLARDMYVSYGQWRFYRQHYNFEMYEPAQIRECHIGVLVDEILKRQLGFVADRELSCIGKAVLRGGAAEEGRTR
jgi:SAM-dependent methyltransferase